MPKLVVTADRLPYDKQMYARGDVFEASARDAKVLKAIRKAKDYEQPERPAHVDTMKSAPAKKETSDPLADARSEYQAVTGKRAFAGWNLKQLREKIGTYQRRDMRAVE